MSLAVWVILGFLMLLTVGLVLGAAKLERRQQDWEWLHPPNEDGDGISILRDDDPDGTCTR